MDVKTVCGACGATEVVALDEKGMQPLPGKPPAQWFEPDGAGFIKKRRRKNRRMRTIGAVAATHPVGKDGEPVEGEVKEDEGIDAPFTIDELREFTTEYFDAKVLDDGQSEDGELYLARLEMKNGVVREAWFNVKTAELLDVLRVDPEELGLNETGDIISMDDASALALKTVEGEVLAVVAENWNDQDVWIAEMVGKDGNDHDVYISLDGVVVGHDTYEVGLKSVEPASETDPAVEVKAGAAQPYDDLTPASDDPDNVANDPAEAHGGNTAGKEPEVAPDEAPEGEEGGEGVEEKSAVTPEFMAAVAEFTALIAE